MKYIGICDFTNAEQIKNLLPLFNNDIKLMAGLMMSRKTLTGQPTKWKDVFPKKEEIQNIFQDFGGKVLCCLHYADFEGLDIFNNLTLATKWAGPNANFLQLDMIWPGWTAVCKYRDKYPNIKIILQVNTRAMEYLNNNPDRVARKLALYEDAIDFALLDKSMGKGLGMDAQALLPYARAIRDMLPDLGIAVAGGLGPDTMDLVEPIIKEFPNISIDAQSKLRPTGNAMDPIDWGMAEEYVKKALKILGG